MGLLNLFEKLTLVTKLKSINLQVYQIWANLDDVIRTVPKNANNKFPYNIPISIHKEICIQHDFFCVYDENTICNNNFQTTSALIVFRMSNFLLEYSLFYDDIKY